MSHWQTDANCADADRTTFDTDVLTPDALALCDSCPVRTACLAHAIANDEHGIWAGTTRGERQRFRNRHHLPVRPVTATGYVDVLDPPHVPDPRSRQDELGRAANALLQQGHSRPAIARALHISTDYLAKVLERHRRQVAS